MSTLATFGAIDGRISNMHVKILLDLLSAYWSLSVP